MKTVTHKLNSLTAVTLVNNTYDDLGRLKKNSRNGVSSLSDTYEYNVRSWLIGISGAQHTEDLTYDYNGNISSMQWRLDGTTRKYAYSYDPLSRLVSATFSGGKDAERYSTSYSYDKHGNILSLQRYGKTANSDLGVYGLADNLTMTYNGNQLTNVSDAAVTVTLPESNDFKKGSAANPGYAYDKNGNLTKDLNKKITAISYNSLYLPELLTIDGVTHKYTYAADGRKLKVVQGSTNRDYVGNLIYENGSLKKILVEGGYIEGGTYYFYFNDHLGNVRAVIDGGNHNIQFNHYYPYGLPMAETTDGKQNEQPYKYNGKEFERKNGLNWMDYGARMYDAALGRFTTMDPLAEKYYGVSPYVYCGNNPINKIDPDGRQGIPLTVPAYSPLPIYYSPSQPLFRYPTGQEMVKDIKQGVNNVVSSIKNQAVLTSGIVFLMFYDVKQASSPEYKHQRSRDRRNKEGLDKNQANVAKSIENNITATTPSGDPMPKRDPDDGGKKTKIGLGVGAIGLATEFGLELTNPDPSKNAVEAHTEKIRQQPVEKKLSLWETIKSWF